jgi:hypothetical protein
VKQWPRTPPAVPGTSTKLDHDLAKQLEDLANESYAKAPGTSLRPALIESGVWVLGAIGLWIVAACLA